MRLAALLLSLLQPILAITSNRTVIGELLILDGHPRGRRAVLVNDDPHEPCRIYGHSNPIQVIENLPMGPTLRTINQEEWAIIVAECHERMQALNQNLTPATDRRFIYPGTKWCGLGDVADDFDDIGIHASTDKCCREHDHCHDYMSPGTCKYGLCNYSIFTKSHCDCDERFRRCLLNETNDKASTSVGFIFFSVSALSCYQQSPDCGNKISRRRRRQFRTAGMASSTRWCFIRPRRRPFKKPKYKYYTLAVLHLFGFLANKQELFFKI
uniref:Phospholipase A2 n=1 Tax=Daphnia galeata TaxID=27404 RepID=A0A8J2RP12_9CRUS|nr:unnamed protein product [Daphnia galeata]